MIITLRIHRSCYFNKNKTSNTHWFPARSTRENINKPYSTILFSLSHSLFFSQACCFSSTLKWCSFASSQVKLPFRAEKCLSCHVNKFIYANGQTMETWLDFMEICFVEMKKNNSKRVNAPEEKQKQKKKEKIHSRWYLWNWSGMAFVWLTVCFVLLDHMLLCLVALKWSYEVGSNSEKKKQFTHTMAWSWCCLY